MDQIIGTISIWVQSREKNSGELNKLFTDNSHLVLSRMGYNVEPKCSADCFAVVCLIIRGSLEELEGLNNKINSLEGITSKFNKLA